jgi:O-acetyl-ADP-ribose deacetylase (regulator of RNase III)
VRGIDIWVNSENTNMQMSRHFDRSISSVIRYLGAKKDAKGHVIEDTIANELTKITGDHAHVPSGQVMVTGAGDLERTHKTKRVFHAASVIGQLGEGYKPIADMDIGDCITNALEMANSDDFQAIELRSILFPLMGTGTGRGNLEEKARELIEAAICYLEANPTCRIESIYFLTWSDKELAVCQRILQEAREVVAGTKTESS